MDLNRRFDADDGLEAAANYVHNVFLQDFERSDLYYKLNYNPYQPEKVTISGLATGDYRTLDNLGVSEFTHGQFKAIPQELKEQLRNTQSIYTMGVLPEIGRAYLTVDADLYVWNYEDSSDLAYFDGIPNTITKVAIAKPRFGVFQKNIHYLLVVATTRDIILLASTFSDNDGDTGVSNEPKDFRHADMYLLPDALYKIPNDENTVTDIVATSNGRIFFAENENLFELDFQEKGWFSRKCRKLNHSKSFINYFLPSVSKITRKEGSYQLFYHILCKITHSKHYKFTFFRDIQRLVQLCLDDTKHILYSLSENGSIQVYDLHADGNSLSKVASLSHVQIQKLAAAECQSVDASFFSDIVCISIVPHTQSRYLHLIATTKKGVRLFFSCFPPPSQIPTFETSLMEWMEVLRPSCLRLRHVRLPPGYGISSLSIHPLYIYNAFYSHEVSIMASEASVNVFNLSLFCSSNFRNFECLSENVTQLRLSGLVTVVAQIMPRTQFLVGLECRSLADFPVRDQNEKFIVLCERGIHIIDRRTPVDLLRDILHHFGPDSKQVSSFSQLHGLINVCDMALTILCENGGANSEQKDSALRLFYMLGEEKAANNHISSPVRSMGEWSPGDDSLSNISVDIRSPLFASTPQQQKGYTRSSRDSFQEMQVASNDQNFVTDEVFTSIPMTCRHDALYLHFSRIVGYSWTRPLCELTSDEKLVGIYSADDLEWLLSQLTPFKKVVEEHGLFGNVQEHANPYFSCRTVPTFQEDESSQSERHSLLSFCELLSLSVEVLMLWKILYEHQFEVVAALLNIQTRKRLATANFCSIVVNGRQLCIDLITCLVRHYVGDSATTNFLCNELHICCPSLFSLDDANTTKATELIEEARHLSACPTRTEMLLKAIELLKAGVQKINLAGICQFLYEADFVEGVVELALERAKHDDPKMLAITAYRNHSLRSDVYAQEAFTKRREAYKCITDILDCLLNDERTLGAPNSVNLSRDLIINKVLNSSDELAHVTLFNWLLDNDFNNVVLQSKSPFLETFLHRRVEEGGSSRYLDLLWMFHERNSDFKKAADLLYHLAQRESDKVDIQRRVSYLSQAAICLQSACTDVDTSTAIHDLMLEIRDKFDVAEIQLHTRHLLLSLPETREVAGAITDLDKRLYTVQELFEQFAVPFDLPDIKLALCFCSATYDKVAIEDFYLDIIDRELVSTEVEPRDVRIQRLVTRLVGLGKKYSTVAEFYPIEIILSRLIMRGMREGFPPSFFHFIGTKVRAPISAMINALLNAFREDPFYRINNGAGYYLMQCALHVLNDFANDSSSYSCQQSKKILANKCLDLIAAFLVHLAQPHSSDDVLERKKFTGRFRDLQIVFEAM